MNGIEMVLSYVIAVGIGGLGGYFFTSARHRRDGDGKTVKEWRAEYGDYKQSVNEHFQRSAELFQGLTEQYRQVYSHLAEGAVTLCRDSSDDPRIEALRTGLLTGAVASSSAAVQDTTPAQATAATAATDDAASSADIEAAVSEQAGSATTGVVADTPPPDAAAEAQAEDAVVAADESEAAVIADVGATEPDGEAGTEPEVELDVPSFTALSSEGGSGPADDASAAAEGSGSDEATRSAAA